MQLCLYFNNNKHVNIDKRKIQSVEIIFTKKMKIECFKKIRKHS